LVKTKSEDVNFRGGGRNAVRYAGEVNWDAAGMEGKPRRIEDALSSGDAVLVKGSNGSGAWRLADHLKEVRPR